MNDKQPSVGPDGMLTEEYIDRLFKQWVAKDYSGRSLGRYQEHIFPQVARAQHEADQVHETKAVRAERERVLSSLREIVRNLKCPYIGDDGYIWVREGFALFRDMMLEALIKSEGGNRATKE